jgi:hypothetical protein
MVLLVYGVIAVLLAWIGALARQRDERLARKLPLVIGAAVGSFAAIGVTVLVIVRIVERAEGKAEPSAGSIVIIAALAMALWGLPILSLGALRAKRVTPPPGSLH